jgi:hypothetical protein
VLPCRAEYVHELGLSDDGLCAMDLATVFIMAQQEWQGLLPPENWFLLHHALVSLRSGIAKIFDVIISEDRYDSPGGCLHRCGDVARRL